MNSYLRKTFVFRSPKVKFDILTIFPEAFESYLNTSMLKRARIKKLVDIRVHDLRKFTQDKHKKVDDRPYGGGPGMVLKVEPIIKAIEVLLKPSNSKFRIPDSKQISNLKSKIQNSRTKLILFSATGKPFTQKMAAEWAKKYDRILMIAGHYEGVDERIFKILQAASYKLQAISIGPYVLTGGELPAMVVIDAVSRHIPGFLGKAESLEEKRYGPGVPVYTRPEVFKLKDKTYRVPKVLLSGNHKKIEEWRRRKIKNTV